MDWRVVKFVTGFQYQKSQDSLPLEEKVSLLQGAVENDRRIDLVYLKANDVKSRRVIHPKKVGQMEYLGKAFLGVEAYDENRQAERVFKIERILEMKVVD